MIIARSHYAQLPGEKLRSSNYFSTAELGLNTRIKLTVYYCTDYYFSDNPEEATDVTFSIYVNKNNKNLQDAGEETPYLENLRSGDVFANVEMNELCIAVPENAREGFVVLIDKA